MHIVIGGAFNGKRAYVKQQFPHAQWYEAVIPDAASGCVVLAGLEGILRLHLEEDEQQVAQRFATQLQQLNTQCTELVVILTDMGRGVVPLDAASRQLRDTCGRFYQALFQQAQTITHIWYGIPEILKGR